MVLDVGAGPGTVGRALRAACPGACVVDVEPSRDFAAPGPRVRARAERLPFATASIDAAVSVSSIRHVADRGAALAELRRVISPRRRGVAGRAHLQAPRARVDRHARALGSRWLTWAFGPLVVATAPPAATIAALARAAGWATVARPR